MIKIEINTLSAELSIFGESIDGLLIHQSILQLSANGRSKIDA